MSITPAASTTAAPTVSVYQKQFAALKQYDAQELLYASFLSPDDALANGNAVLSQAAQLLSSKSYETTTPTIPTVAGSTTAPAPTTPADTSDTSTPSTPLQSVTDILQASNDAADAALTAYSKAPAGSSILDFQA